MIAIIHKVFIAGLYLAVIVGGIVWAYSKGPCDAETRIRASWPLAM
jgi:hypothetical protein